MRFEVQGEQPIDGPTPEEVEQGLRTLERDARDFAILEQRPSTYLQTAPRGDGTYELEVQEGSLDQHYRASRPLLLADLIAVFDLYVRQDAGWRSRYEWKPIDVAPPPASRAFGGGVRSTPRVVWSVLLGLVALTVAMGSLANGISATVAGTGVAGTAGQVLVTSCTGRYGQSCSGLFTASSGEVPPSRVSIAGGPYRTPALVPDVHVLNGLAYPPPGAMATELVVNYVVAALALTGAVGCAAIVRRRLGRDRRSRGSVRPGR